MATTAQYASTPTVDIAQVTTANTNRDGTGTTVEVASGPASVVGAGVGKYIREVFITASGSVTAGMVRFFLSTDGGTTKRLITEVLVPAVTVSATVPAFSTTVPALHGLILQGQVSSNSCKLYASTEKSETFNIHVIGGTL